MSRSGRKIQVVDPSTTSNLSGLWGLNEILGYVNQTKWPRGPVAPTSLTVAAGSNQLALNWTAPATTHGTITNHLVEYTPSGGSPQYVLTGSTSTSYTLTGLTNGTTYTVRVAAVNFTMGDYSATATGTPSLVYPLVVSPGTITDNGGIVRTWSGQGSASNKITSGGVVSGGWGSQQSLSRDTLRNYSWTCNLSGTLYFEWGPDWVDHDGSQFTNITSYKKNNNISSSFATNQIAGETFAGSGLWNGSRKKRGISVAANDVIIIWDVGGSVGRFGLPLRAWIE